MIAQLKELPNDQDHDGPYFARNFDLFGLPMKVISEMGAKYYIYNCVTHREMSLVVWYLNLHHLWNRTNYHNTTVTWLKMAVNYTLSWSHSNQIRITWICCTACLRGLLIRSLIYSDIDGPSWHCYFLQVLRFPPSIKLTTTVLLKYCWKWR